MTKKYMLINVADDESRVAIVEDELLQEMLIEHQTKEQIKNNIYKGTVVQVQTSLQAAFVEFGNKKHGFLPSSEIHPNLFQKKNATPHSSIQQKIKPGQSFLVQVTREAIDHKGAALTTNITIPGRFMVLMPNSNKGGVSKRIDSPEERDRLKSFLSGIESEKHAVIIRTAGFGRDLGDLKKDYTSLKKRWEEVQQSFKKAKKPGLVLEEADVVTRTLRDYYTEDIEEVWVDNPEIFQKVLDFIKQVAPRKQKTLKLFVSDRSLFSTYHVERQVEQLSSRDVKLDSGGSIVLEQTEALVAIDVNSGKSNQESDIDATALRTNLEAAKEIARQVRLRNLGGLIVVDFIDMERDDARKKVESELRTAMERDKAHRKYNPISQFGLLEFSRQRLAIGISSTVESVCPTCNGKGRISSMLASTNLIIRSIREMAASSDLVRIEGDLPLELANNLLNERRQSISDLELEFGIKILLRGNPTASVFEEGHLKPIIEKGAQSKPSSSDSEKESTKDNQKRKPRRKEKDGDKDKASKVKMEAKVEPKIDPKTEPVQKELEAPEPKAIEPVIVPAPIAKPAMEDVTIEVTPPSNIPTPAPVIEPTEPGSVHPACLFTDVKELESDELEEVFTNFENRLKGKAADKPISLIASKYLWKNETVKPVSSSNGEETTQAIEAVSEVDSTGKGEDKDLKSDDQPPLASEKGKRKSAAKKPRKPSRGRGGQKSNKDVSKDTKPSQSDHASKSELIGEDPVMEDAKENKPERKKRTSSSKSAKSKSDTATKSASTANRKKRTTQKKPSEKQENVDADKAKSSAKKTTTKKATQKEADKPKTNRRKRTAPKKTSPKEES